ncbi:rod shape-determining protein RodA [Candidatus Kaiserbacteria bacterium CG10_big_fil_rev_8_21_14_0_10_49_17]|uniref:Rod shape-determining protein RodA n=1 Tax=Candidatus Kaiserbacteria bacterium CG10_big_fil_rev_8_21_14_0_10_49_17 TaxID=1974609 RepID=A0A2M6WDV0_9BACT|nr:MAG: rod shape-determining protein RodA [Candidatus Kaiserbacteria bacterium CG10_big_fil_rev_8_21_14_0_10_49_17]
MTRRTLSLLLSIDWLLFGSSVALVAAGILTMNSFTSENYFFENQLIWASIAIGVFFVLSFVDFRFLRRTTVITTLYGFTILLLILVFFFGDVVKGAQSRFDFGAFSLQPSDPAKLVAILLLSKYFTRRHIEIANVRHILVSGFYIFALFALIAIQPDFGSAIIIALIWFGMVLVSGISKKHLVAVLLIGALAGVGMWSFVFADYQKQRIITFLNPLTDIQGTGYNAYQSTIAVGSGELLGKGVGYGTQSKLQFLPEYETDFIFAAFAEEWGFVGVTLLFILFALVIWRVLENAKRGASNFEVLFGVGLATLFIAHFSVHIGMNLGLMPVTGTTVPFMSYGGSHLITEFIGLGILMGMRRYNRTVHRSDEQNEVIGL